MTKILIVDDDPFIRQLIKLALRGEEMQLLDSSNGVEALEMLERTRVDLMILDIMMPQMDGWELCREVRARYPDLPLLMVTAKSEQAHKVKGFQLGTDDYVVKPFDPLELAMRVKALMKRYKINVSQTVQIGDVELNRSNLEVVQGGQRQTLPLKEFELLFKLAGHPNQVFTRNQLVDQIWGMDYEGEERTVDVHIKRLRERFPEETSSFAIVTVRGLGYKLELRA
ncbi:response regulator transcription factor [Paenibacillus doosanensis]|uniref:response regulator transcription factor n=1 Tax=Paenibacillus doosanensis TaxID=1229154 RepID=UPI00217F7473|nr:response regulator transcription factor [Paenibacillus doosanensis]MCS7461719.1 response regulator transcription factor [Paenibacillus doosanensis]